MSRGTLRRALDARDGSAVAIVPLIWRHAFRLEQMVDECCPMQAEAIARALRNVQALYDVDAVTVGADEAHLAAACWSAAYPTWSEMEAWSAVEQRRSLTPLPEPKAVPLAAPLVLLVDVLTRLRPVLGENAGIAFVLPDPRRLISLLGVPDARSWTNRVLIEVIRSIGSLQPDLVLFSGDEGFVEQRLVNVCDFFQAPALHLAENVPGKVILGAADLCDPAPMVSTRPWLYTTEHEIDPASKPECVRSALLALRELRR